MTTKIKIKLGPIEVDYEGSEEFLRSELPELLRVVTTLHQSRGFAQDDISTPGASPVAAAVPAALPDVTTATIATRIKAETGAELALAAAMRLVLLGKTTFNRGHIL
jgi:hypothetical protein